MRSPGPGPEPAASPADKVVGRPDTGPAANQSVGRPDTGPAARQALGRPERDGRGLPGSNGAPSPGTENVNSPGTRASNLEVRRAEAEQDRALIEAAQKADRAPFRQLVDRHQRRAL